jgi:hypothetical protein
MEDSLVRLHIIIQHLLIKGPKPQWFALANFHEMPLWLNDVLSLKQLLHASFKEHFEFSKLAEFEPVFNSTNRLFQCILICTI